ncbi:MAG: BolA/IbaG family iron-sulfur metabolism protein [Pseudomonadales bacterium]
MTVKDTIEEKLANAIVLKHMEVINESGNHNVPAGSESHFKVVLVADEFIDQRLVARHRRVNEILADELKVKIHALSIHTYTQEEWRARNGDAPLSPPCRG